MSDACTPRRCFAERVVRRQDMQQQGRTGSRIRRIGQMRNSWPPDQLWRLIDER
jgi:hypothetical protein